MTLVWHFSDEKYEKIEELGFLQSNVLNLCANEKILSALKHHDGSTIYQIQIKNEDTASEYDLRNNEYSIVWKMPGHKVLLDFAQKCALDVLYLWDAPQNVSNFLKQQNTSNQKTAYLESKLAFQNICESKSFPDLVNILTNTTEETIGQNTARTISAAYAARAAGLALWKSLYTPEIVFEIPAIAVEVALSARTAIKASLGFTIQNHKTDPVLKNLYDRQNIEITHMVLSAKGEATHP